MNERIIYEDEEIVEEVYNGNLILDGHMTEEQQKKHIFEMMRNDGIEVLNEDEYSIGYVGADDNDGLSETQTSDFVVTRTYKKQVPYKITTEEIYTGEYILDGLRKSEAEQRREIFEMMKKDGIEVEDDDSIVIGYVGADDNDGLSETQSSKFVVQRITKERIEQVLEEQTNTSMEVKNHVDTEITEEDKIRKLYDELVELRDKVKNTDSIDEIKTLYNRINEVTSLLDDLIDNSTKNYGPFEDSLKDIDKEIFAIEELYANNSKEYEELYDEMKAILEEQSNLIKNSSVSQEEFDKLNNDLIDRKKSCNDQSLRVKKKMDSQLKDLTILYKKKERINSDFNIARSLGIPAADFIEIVDKLGRRDIIDSVIASRELSEIISMSYNNRTTEDKQKLKDAKSEIYQEVEKAKKVNEVDSVLNMIDALYATDTTKEENGKRRVLLVKPDSLVTINDKVKTLPEKIVNSDDKAPNYVPLEAPKDMKEVLDSINENNNLLVEKEDEKVLEHIVENNNEIVQENHTLESSDELIPGTSIKKPRGRNANETEEDYVAYLEDYYNNVFASRSEENNDILKDKIVLYRDSDRYFAKGPVLDRFSSTRVGDMVRIDNAACYEIDAETAEYIINNANNSYSPYIVEVDDRNDIIKNNISSDDEIVIPQISEDGIVHDSLTDKFVIYTDKNDASKLYAKKPVFDRFNLIPQGDLVRIDGVACYPIAREDAEYIVGNANNSYSPYIVASEEAEVVHENVQENIVQESLPNEEVRSDDLLTDRFVIYADRENLNNLYAKKPVFDRFNIDPQGDLVRINGVACYPISKEDVDYIVGNANNSYSPYTVVFEDADIVHENTQNNVSINNDFSRDNVDKEKTNNTEIPSVDFVPSDTNNSLEDDEKVTPPTVDDDTLKGPPVVESHNDGDITPPMVDDLPRDDDTIHNSPREEIITLYRDITNNNQVYVSDEVARKLGIPVGHPSVKIDGHDCYKISRDTDQIINSIAKMSRDPKFVVVYKDVELEKENSVVKPHVEEIIDKLTRDLDIRARDCKRYTASNLKIAKSFKEELSSGNVAYNIVHVVPAVIKAGVSFIRKLTGKLLTSARAKDAMATISERLDDLSEVELEVLFDEYKGSLLKTDMNNQINPLILDKLREFGLSKVARLNDEIKVNYTILFTILGQVSALEEQLDDETLSNAEAVVLDNQRRQLISQAANSIRAIESARVKANNLLSSGVHGIEEDFKAVATKLNYVGMRFAKSNDFDNELQSRLGQFGRGLEEAKANGDDLGIVQNFMGLESCYYENTEIRNSVVGKRSVGSKYYTPMAEQFDYRNDPFIHDLLTTVAVTSATISAINAARVHQIESQQILNEQKAQADTVNMQNDSTMDYVHQTGQNIADKRDTFREGMEAQANQDVLTNSGVIERANLDLHNWKFGSAYRAADDAGHEAFNQFSADVTNQINSVSSQYASGAITSAEALERITQISTDAQNTLIDTVQSSLDIIRDYASTHPQFDLSAVESSMSYLVSHPGAIADMNRAMTDVTNLAEGLTSLSATHMSALTSLPSDMASTIVCAASSALLAMNVANSMSRSYGKKKSYGDEITEMMDEYIYGPYGSDEVARSFDEEYDDEDDYDDEYEDERHR